jgi:CRP-like cAMP-binding protein
MEVVVTTRPGMATLRAVPAFEQLDDDLLDQIDGISEVFTAHHGEVLCRQGTLPTVLYVVLEGHVALSSTTPDDSTAVVEVLSAGRDFVLASVMAGLPYMQSAHVVQRSRLLAIEARPLRALIERESELSFALLRTLSGEFRALVRQIRDLKVRTTAQRLACYLLALVPDPNSDNAEFRLPFEKGLLAARLGCRQENLSRAFAALRRFGVETRGASVTLHDVPRLTAYGQPDYLTDVEFAKSLAVARRKARLSAPASA